MPLMKARLEQLIAHSSDIVVATDRKGVVIYYNDGAEAILGYSPKEVLGTFVGSLYPDVGEAKRVMVAMRGSDHGDPGSVQIFRTDFRTKSGEEVPVAISGGLIRDDAGEEDGTIGFAKDLRDILHRDQLAVLGEVAVGLSHEINNPLAVIVNQAELLERDIESLAGEKDASVEIERLDAIRREIGRVSEVLDRLGEMAEADNYQTVNYIGPARMIDLRSADAKRVRKDERLRGLRVLVVDDDLGIARSLREVLEVDGCVVQIANDGLQALAHLKDETFDVVLSDVVMPNMDGYELFRTIQERFSELPVLMMTAFHYDKDHIIKRSRMRGLQGVIFKKPVDPVRLRTAILESVEAHQAKGPGDVLPD
jgi:PAS domain S-box-containing protein